MKTLRLIFSYTVADEDPLPIVGSLREKATELDTYPLGAHDVKGAYYSGNDVEIVEGWLVYRAGISGTDGVGSVFDSEPEAREFAQAYYPDAAVLPIPRS